MTEISRIEEEYQMKHNIQSLKLKNIMTKSRLGLKLEILIVLIFVFMLSVNTDFNLWQILIFLSVVYVISSYYANAVEGVGEFKYMRKRIRKHRKEIQRIDKFVSE